jgi:hypothetical protein
VTTTDLAAALSRHWGVAVASVTYRPVGAGSYHWAVADPTGGGWFVTADDLEVKRRSRRIPSTMRTRGYGGRWTPPGHCVRAAATSWSRRCPRPAASR